MRVTFANLTAMPRGVEPASGFFYRESLTAPSCTRGYAHFTPVGVITYNSQPSREITSKNN